MSRWANEYARAAPGRTPADFDPRRVGVTRKQLRVLKMTNRLTFPRGPTVRELAESLGLQVRGAHEHLQALARKGLVELAGQGRARGLVITPKGRKVLRG